jgi:uncharacterized protein (DUF2235 family)
LRRQGTEQTMKRIVLLIDGTWNTEAASGNTNVAKFDSAAKIFVQAMIKGQVSN